MRRSSADAVVIGAGAIGCAIARTLAGRGVHVIVVERDSPGRHATWAAAGMLSPLGEAAGPGPFLELSAGSLDRYAALAASLREETGIDVEYRTAGRLHVSLGDADAELEAIAASPLADRFAARALDAAEARRIEPALTPDVTRALLVGRDHRVNSRRLAQALHAGATAAGADIRSNRPAEAVIGTDGVATGVRLTSGECLTAGQVILAAGAWSAGVEGVPQPLPVRPVRGQMFAVDARSPDMEAALEHVVFERRCYIIPRDDGRLLIGATVEDVGFAAGPTPRGLADLMAAATAVLPVVQDLPVVETWAGFRPGTPDQLPILGADPEMKGLIHATGHFRNGILLAPITAECIAALVLDEAPPIPLEPFSVARFR